MTLQDILNTAGNDVNAGYKAIAALLNQPKTRTKQTGAVSQTLQNLGQTFQVPIQQAGHAIAPGIIPGVTSQQQQQAQAGAEFGMGAIQGQPEADALSQSLGIGVDTAKTAAKAGVQSAKETAGDIAATAKAQPGGLQAGFIGLGKKAETTAPVAPASPVRINLKPSVYGAGREAAVQQTVDTVVPGTTATEKYNNLEPTMSNLGDKITTIMAQDPKTTSLNQLINDFDKNLQDNGIYRTADNAKSTVQKTAQGYIEDLVNAAGGNGVNPNPLEITDTALQKMKQSVNQDAQSVYKKIGNKTSLTDKDRVILQARQTLDDTITDLHPEVKDLTTQQSHLYDAADSLYKGREAELKAAGQPTNANTFMGNLKQGIVNHPIGSLVTGTGLLTGLGITGAVVATGLTQPSAPNYKLATTNANIPQLTDITDNSGNNLTENVASYNNQLQQLSNQKAALEYQAKLGIPSAQAQLSAIDDKLAPIQAKLQTTQAIIKAHTDTVNQITGLKEAAGLISKAPPEWYQVLGGKASPFTDIKTRLNPGFSAWQQNLDFISSKYGIDLSGIKNAGSAAAADSAINSQIKSTQENFKQTVIDNGGVWPGEQPQASGKDILQSQMQQIANPTAAPTQAPQQPEATPTPNLFQRLSNSSAQGQLLSQ